MKTPLNHFILYCKGWYNRTENIFEDLKKILVLDDYTPFSNNDVLSIIINQYERDFKDNLRLVNLLSDIDPKNSWKISYYTKGNADWLKPEDRDILPEYDYYTAILYKIMSEYRFKELKTELSPPKYSKTNPRPKNIKLQKVIEMFNTKKLITI